MKCFHHNDLDGMCSAAIILSKYPYCETISMDYNKDPQPYIKSLLSGELVFIVDFSFKPEIMSQICQKSDVIWIDHHKTILDHPFNRPDVKGIRDISKSGCELTWEYIYPNKDKMFDIPEVVKLIGDYDTWKMSMMNTIPFYYGLLIEDCKPENYHLWNKLFKNNLEDLNDILMQGEIILKYQKVFSKEFGTSYGFETLFNGHFCFAQNCYMRGSLQFEEKLDNYDICIIFAFDGTNYIIGLYSTKIDVAEIAKKYNGGGHKGASGFICKSLPFKKIEKD